MKLFTLIVIAILFASCNTGTNEQNEAKDSLILKYDNIPAERSSVNPNAAKTYSEVVKSFEITDSFVVSLYETKNTFHYLIKIQYKNLEAEDTLKVPDFGISPSVEIIKGDSRPSCIVGFLDKDKKFRESKLIYTDDNKLKIHVLKHYAVATYQDTLKTNAEH
jgi:hypothetical protein